METDESATIAKCFRFSSGQCLILGNDQIEKIPYLTALVSAGPHFDSIRVNEGYYSLHSGIHYEDFLFALNSVSFTSLRQLFTRLPKTCNTLAIIALLDFLGLAPETVTLEEVDSSFFWNAEFGDSIGVYKLVYKRSYAQDMAVRFAITLAKEEYDFQNEKVCEQIYWFVMFIFSAYEWFDSHLRYHVYKIAENCFSLFCPPLLQRLGQLQQRIETNMRAKSTSTSSHLYSSRAEDLCWHAETFRINSLYDIWKSNFFDISDPAYWPHRRPTGEMYHLSMLFEFEERRPYIDLDIKPILRKVVNYMYKCLLNTILEELLVKPRCGRFGQRKRHTFLDDVMNSATVHETIQENLLFEISKLKAKPMEPYVEKWIMTSMYERSHDSQFASSVLRSAWMVLVDKNQREVSTSEYESAISIIRTKILEDLHNVFIYEINNYLEKRRFIKILADNLLAIETKQEEVLKLKKKSKICTVTKYRPLPKTQRQ